MYNCNYVYMNEHEEIFILTCLCDLLCFLEVCHPLFFFFLKMIDLGEVLYSSPYNAAVDIASWTSSLATISNTLNIVANFTQPLWPNSTNEETWRSNFRMCVKTALGLMTPFSLQSEGEVSANIACCSTLHISCGSCLRGAYTFSTGNWSNCWNPGQSGNSNSGRYTSGAIEEKCSQSSICLGTENLNKRKRSFLYFIIFFFFFFFFLNFYENS